MEVKTAVLLGASGLIGNHLLQLLLQDDQYRHIRVLVRRPLEIADPRLETIVVDFNNQEEFKYALGKGDAIFCCIGTTMKNVKGDKTRYRQIDHDIPVNAAQWGFEAGFSQYAIISSVGANSKSSNFYLRLKGEVEDAVQSLSYPSLHIFRPSILLGKHKETRTGENMAQAVMPVLSFLFFGSLKKYRAVKAEDVARAMLGAVQAGIPGQHVYEYTRIRALSAR